MIILNFLFDYLVMIFLPINTFLIVNELDDNNLFSVILVGVLFDIMYHKLLIFMIILVSLYLVFKKLRIKSKYYYIKNILLYLVFFMIISLFNRSFNLINFILGSLFQVVYMITYKKLLK